MNIMIFFGIYLLELNLHFLWRYFVGKIGLVTFSDLICYYLEYGRYYDVLKVWLDLS